MHVNPTNWRGMFIAVAKAFNHADYRSTRRTLKRKLHTLKYDPDVSYSVFKLKFNRCLTDLANLKNKRGKSAALDPEDQVDSLMSKFQEEESGLPPDQRSRWATVFTNMEMNLDEEDELTVEDIHARVETEIYNQRQAGGDYYDFHGRSDGRNHAQKGKHWKSQRQPSEQDCRLCGSKEHWAQDCPVREKTKRQLCKRYSSKSGCPYSKSACDYYHPESDGDDYAKPVLKSEPQPDQRHGVSSSIRFAGGAGAGAGAGAGSADYKEPLPPYPPDKFVPPLYLRGRSHPSPPSDVTGKSILAPWEPRFF